MNPGISMHYIQQNCCNLSSVIISH